MIEKRCHGVSGAERAARRLVRILARIRRVQYLNHGQDITPHVLQYITNSLRQLLAEPYQLNTVL
jgi:hypothetical protein